MRPGLGLAALVAASCGGGQRTAEPLSARAPELVVLSPRCDGERLKALEPIEGLEQRAVEQHAMPDPRLARTHERLCEIVESDETCVALARFDVTTADAQAEIGDVSISGERDGWSALLEVDGVPQRLSVADERDVLVEARRLQARGHQVVPVEGHVVYRPAGRRAIINYDVPVRGVAPSMRWELALRGPVPAEVSVMLARLQQTAEQAGLVVVSFAVDVDDGVSAVLACP